MRPAVLAPVILFMLGGCTGVVGCPFGGWYEVAVSFGSEGSPVSKIEDYEKVCERARSPAAREAWLAGWEEGHRQYCTPKGAYWVGRDKGIAVRTEICPADVSAQLKEANKMGLKYYEIEEEIEEEIEWVNESISEEIDEYGFMSFFSSLKLELLREKQKNYDLFLR